MDILLEFAYILGAKCMRNSFPLASVLSAVSCVEQAALNRDEGIVVVSMRYSSATVLESR